MTISNDPQGRALGFATARNKIGREIGTARQRLSSGFRINSASDDPAGEALAANNEADGVIYTRVAREAATGTSVFALASETISHAATVLTELQEVTQRGAASGLSSDQRTALQSEADALVGEYNRIATSSKFNSKTLFSSELSSVTISGGPTAGDTVTASLLATVSQVGGNGTYGTSVSYTQSQTETEHIAGADFNADGFVDLVAVSAAGAVGYIGVRLNNGDGTFGAELTLGGGVDGYSSVSAGDIDGDGDLDIVATRYLSGGSGRIVSALGNGDGTFASITSVALAAVNPYALKTADVNEDGRSDVIFTDAASNNIFISLGQATGTFATPTTIGSGTNPLVLSVGDLNNDGHQDIVSHTSADTRLNVSLGNGDGTFAARVSYASVASSEVLLADLNDDGNLDAITNSTTQAVVRLGVGDGTFGAATTLATTHNQWLTSGDINNDGNLDVIGADRTSGTIVFLLGNGSGSLSAGGSYSAGATPEVPIFFDLNGDSAGDLAWVNDSTTSIRVALGNASTTAYTAGLDALDDVDLSTRASSLQAASGLEVREEQLTQLQGKANAGEARFGLVEEFSAALGNSFKASAEKIREVDVAEEVVKLVKAQIVSAGIDTAQQQHSLSLQRVVGLLTGLGEGDG